MRPGVLLDEATALPGGMLALVVSGPAYNAARPWRLVVEAVTEALLAAGALLPHVWPSSVSPSSPNP